MDYYFKAHKTKYDKLPKHKKVEAENVMDYSNYHEEYPKEANFVGEYLKEIFRTKEDNHMLDELDYKGLISAWYYYEGGKMARDAIELAWCDKQERDGVW